MTTEGPAPAVTLKAIGHGRQLTFNALGTPAVVMCVARESSDQPQAVVDVVREKWRDAAKVMIVNVADGRAFPKLIHKVAEQIMKSSYNDAVAGLEPGMKPEDYVLIAPDWDGKLLKPLGFEDVSKQMGVAVIDGSGNLVGTYQGDDAPGQTVVMVEKALGT
ncbi:MAG: hypothetical protein EPO22_14995 [Dehalococcoidia bacterium]|nr:MAG: hypothetical protein EPO22_14995 [Dehalococcoidia bacterium]